MPKLGFKMTNNLEKLEPDKIEKEKQCAQSKTRPIESEERVGEIMENTSGTSSNERTYTIYANTKVNQTRIEFASWAATCVVP